MAKKFDPFTQISMNTLRLEGGVNENEIGQGGVSNLGITQATLNNIRKAKGLPSMDVRELTYGEAKDLMKEEFYTRPKLDKLPFKTSGVVFDYAVHSGSGRAVKALQKAVGAKDDGVIGPKTLAKVNKYVSEKGEDALVEDILQQRRLFIEELIESDPLTFGPFEKGFMNRIEKVRALYGAGER